MLRSLFSGVAGLTSHQTKLDVIGNNIANVNTYGFKASRVTFSDIYYQTTKAATGASATQGGVNSSQIGYGTNVSSIDKLMSQSSFASTSNTLDIAISGEGFIQVQDATGNKYFTRAGMLNVDSEGNLVDTSGYFVLGTQNYDPENLASMSNIAGNAKIKINVPSVFTAEFLNEAYAVSADADGNGTASNISGVVLKMGFYEGNQEQNIELKVTNDNSKKSSVTEYVYDEANDKYTLTVNLNTANGKEPTTVSALQDAINEVINGELDNPTLDGNGDGTPDFTDETFTGGNLSISYDTTSAIGTAGTAGVLNEDENADLQAGIIDTILASGTTPIEMESTEQPQTFSDLSSFYISGDGTLVGVHSVLGMLYFGRIDLATFDNPQGLDEIGNSYYSESAASGSAKYAIPGYDGSGSVVSGSLEMSNVNLATEFSDLITTQRGYQANARIITTSDSILEELVNLKR